MRGTTESRTSTAVAVVAAIVAVVAVMSFPGLGIGEPTVIHGGPPSDVFMRQEAHPDDCSPIGVNVHGVDMMPLQFETAVRSHLLVYFTFEWSRFNVHENGQVNPRLDGSDDALERRFKGSATRGGHVAETVMSSFPDVAPGTHTVDIYGAVAAAPGGSERPLLANLENCLLTVMVLPAAA